MQTACRAIAKVIVNKRLNTLRIIATFDTSASKISAHNAAFVSGDICDAKIDPELRQIKIDNALAIIAKQLRTDNIQVI